MEFLFRISFISFQNRIEFCLFLFRIGGTAFLFHNLCKICLAGVKFHLACLPQ